uniref:Protein PHLOEM PROTEIN 2-LIKE A1-like n=1 Tax=Cucumis melo TaxID=3656 RepID=A0A9I9DHX7_CUCME
MCDKGSVAKEKLGAEVKYGHCLEVICKDADVQLHWPSFDELYAQVSHGIILHDGCKKYKLDKNTNCNWWLVGPKCLSIAWIDDTRYWRWITINESGETWFVAELLQVSWFDMRAKISATALSSRVVYDAIFIIMLTDRASGWEVPVSIELKRPNGCKIESKVSLQGVKRGEWVEIVVGDFIVDNCSCESGGEIEVSMYQHGGHWKRGLHCKGVEFRPRGSCVA